MDLLFASECAAFLVAIVLMLAIGFLEALALLAGAGLSGMADDFLEAAFDPADASPEAPGGDAGASGLIGRFFGWLHVGRAPLLVLIVLFLMGFALIGLSIQWVYHQSVGAFASPWAVVPVAVAASLFFVRAAGALVVRYLPKDETTAVNDADFVGLSAVITIGEASLGDPAQARLTDEHGQLHYIRVEPDDASDRFVKGQTVLIVAHVSGSLYRAIADFTAVP